MKKLKKTKQVKIKIIKEVNGIKPGTKIDIETDENGIPLKKYWRRRLNDAKIDGCLVIVTKKQKKSKPTE